MVGRTRALVCFVALASLAGCNQRHEALAIEQPRDWLESAVPEASELPPEDPFDGPGPRTNPNVHPTGDAQHGMAVFRYETFGNEGFWTAAARLPQGLMAAKLTPLGALQLGLRINSDAVDPSLRHALQEEAATDLSPESAPRLNDPQVLLSLLDSNAVAGLVVKDTDGNGRLEVAAGDRVGVSCALCHSVTDGTLLRVPGGGSMGRELDGPTAWALETGELAALAENSRALFPLLQVSLPVLGGMSLGGAQEGVNRASTEAQVDAWLRANWRPGTFDVLPDGVGAPTQIQPTFRTDRGAPWGHDGAVRRLDDFVNFVYTVTLDPTTLLTPPGTQLLQSIAGDAGLELAREYALVLQETGVRAYPFVTADAVTVAGTPEGFVGLRVEEKKLQDLAAYTDRRGALPAPYEPDDVVARGHAVFKRACTGCHRSTPQLFVPPQVVGLRQLWPDYSPVPLPLSRLAPFDAAADSPAAYDDRVVLMNASARGLVRGFAMPQLVELHRKPAFLHDGSVPSLDELLSPARGPTAPHPFYVPDDAERSDVVRYLRTLE